MEEVTAAWNSWVQLGERSFGRQSRAGEEEGVRDAVGSQEPAARAERLR